MARTMSPADLSWKRSYPVEGRCQDCGEDIAAAVVITATTDWVRRVESIEQLRRSMHRAVADKAMERHARECRGRGRRG
jgi:hypothetical protein